MSKIDYTQFKCDNCNIEVVKLAKTGFPYDKGWVYLYNIDGVVGHIEKEAQQSDLNSIKYNKKDLHFCCVKCEVNYIENLLNTIRATRILPEMKIN